MSGVGTGRLVAVSEFWRCPGDPTQCPGLRHRTRTALHAFAHVVDDAELVISELFGNACRHTRSGQGGTVAVSISALRTGFVVLTVTDDGPLTDPATGRPRVPRLADPAPLAIGHRGLRLVADVCDLWGCSRTDEGGHAVWAAFESPLYRPFAALSA
ncbi:histidine kinase-like protein [Murinocardiopsis flavida]|uniref:Histidine kinase-like protein n=2 Tax=Murinocardiopsis flavida TaxID=645275 RepID=A0A2P8DES7_9ACTN|nr:histidine kinase-like protein [Murinocardiopsis flavida]